MSEDRLAIPPEDPTPLRPSPKRKRTDSISVSEYSDNDTIFAPQIDVKLKPLPDHLQRSVSPPPDLSSTEALPSTPRKPGSGIDTPPALPGASSPRTFVANKFGNLSLRGAGDATVRFGHGFGVESQHVNKKARTGGFGLDGSFDIGVAELSDVESRKKSWSVGHSHGVWHNLARTQRMKAGIEEIQSRDSSREEVPETPQRHHRHKHISVEVVIPSIEPHEPTRLQSKSAKSPTHTVMTQKSKSKSPPAPYRFDLTSLTWHDNEITGHLGLDPDDDGTGINGVGFRPTPAIAYARSQKRKQQVAEWKRREAGEERRRRIEARRRSGYLGVHTIPSSSDPGPEGGGSPTRKVRFAEV